MSKVKQNIPARKEAGYSGKAVKAAVEEPALSYGLLKAVEYLGGKSLGAMAVGIKEEHDFIPLIKKGIPRKSVDFLMAHTGLSPNEMAAVMHTSDRTLRRYKPSKLLNTEQSERVVELARLYSRGEEVFGNADRFKEWMASTVMALGNRTPKEFLDTSLGIELLMDELGRIEHGIFS